MGGGGIQSPSKHTLQFYHVSGQIPQRTRDVYNAQILKAPAIAHKHLPLGLIKFLSLFPPY